MAISKHPAIDFGTSGLRGPGVNFTMQNVAAYIGAFLRRMDDGGEKRVYVGADLRQSSPRITAQCIAAITANGWQPVYGGNVPTPALACFALARNCPAIMVTGSHIPKTYNGIKFYRRDGELLKQDEAPISSLAKRLLEDDVEISQPPLPAIMPDIARDYVARFCAPFPASALKGLKLGVDMHSAVGRDLLVEILTALGASCFPFNRSEQFIAVDTEALGEEEILRAKSHLKEHGLDAIVSTDGDGDRPLLLDENGAQINGDVLGALCARSLGIDIVVTPLSSTSSIEMSSWFNKVIRTRIGSPHVVAAMAQQAQNHGKIAGFEANGGFLTQTDIELANGTISRLPTRDALLPLITVLAQANSSRQLVSQLANSLPPRFMKAGRIKDIKKDVAREFLAAITTSHHARTALDARLKEPAEINTLDGVRLILADTSIVHFRQSGNAPEMRCYVETGTREQTDTLLKDMLGALAARLAEI